MRVSQPFSVDCGAALTDGSGSVNLLEAAVTRRTVSGEKRRHMRQGKKSRWQGGAKHPCNTAGTPYPFSFRRGRHS